MCVAVGDTRNIMYVGEIDEDGWVDWKFIESKISTDDIKKLEEQLGVKIPKEIKQYFLISFHHMVEQINNGDYLLSLVPFPAESPFSEFSDLINAWSQLPKFGYIPFAQYQDGCGPICFKVEDKSIVWFDHEVMPFEPVNYNSDLLKANENVLHKNIHEFWTQQLKVID